MVEENDNFSLDVFVRNTIDFYLSLIRLTLRGIKKYWMYSILIFILFGLLFVWQSTHTVTYYQAESSYTFNYLHKKVYGDMFYDIEQLIDKQSYQDVANILDLPLKTTQTIVSLRARNILNKPLHEDFTPRKVPFYVHVTTTSKESLPEIQGAVTQYFLTNPFAVKAINEQQIVDRKNLTFIEGQLEMIDSLIANHAAIEEPNQLKEWMAISEAKAKEKHKIQQQLKTSEAVGLLKPFQAIEIKREVILRQLAIKYSSIALVLSVVLSAALYWYKNPQHER